MAEALKSVMAKLSVEITMKKGGSAIQNLMNLAEALKSNGLEMDKSSTVYFHDDHIEAQTKNGEVIVVRYE